MKIGIEIIMPKMFNFLRTSNGGTIDLGELSEEEYYQFEQKYREELYSHYKKRKIKKAI